MRGFRDVRAEFEYLCGSVDSQLAESCPNLPMETRVTFAAQIAAASLRADRGESVGSHLHEFGGGSN